MEREREVTRLRRIHEREIYILKRKLHEATQRDTLTPSVDQGCGIIVAVPSFTMAGAGGNAHIEYTVKVVCQDDSWTILRRFRRFRDLVSTSVKTQIPDIEITAPFEYSNHLKTGLVRYSNGQKLAGLQMVWFSNGI